MDSWKCWKFVWGLGKIMLYPVGGWTNPCVKKKSIWMISPRKTGWKENTCKNITYWKRHILYNLNDKNNASLVERNRLHHCGPQVPQVPQQSPAKTVSNWSFFRTDFALSETANLQVVLAFRNSRLSIRTEMMKQMNPIQIKYTSHHHP